MEITLQYFDGCPNWEVLDDRLAPLDNVLAVEEALEADDEDAED